MFDRIEEKEVKLPPLEFEDEDINDDALDAILAGFQATVTGSLAVLKQKFDSGVIDAQQYQSAVAEIFSPENSNNAVSGFINAFDKIRQLFDEKDGINPEVFKQQFTASFADIADAALAVADTIGGVFANIADIQNNREDTELAEYESKQAAKVEALDNRLERGLISEAAYNSQIEKIDAETDKKQKQLEYDQAKRSKKLAIFNAAVNGAGAIINAALTQPFIPAGLIATALATALIGTQIAAISSQPLPQLATGGYIVGGSGTWNSDNQHAMLSPKEAVINARSMQSSDILSLTGTPAQIAGQINSYKGYGVKFATGKAPSVGIGSAPTANALQSVNINMDSFAMNIINGINDKRVINVASDTETVINRNNVINRAGDV